MQYKDHENEKKKYYYNMYTVHATRIIDNVPNSENTLSSLVICVCMK